MGFLDRLTSRFRAPEAPARPTEPAWAKAESTAMVPAAQADAGEVLIARPVTRVTHSRPDGATGTVVTGGKIRYEEWNTEVEGSKGYGSHGRQGVFDKMRRTDPQIRRSLELLKLPIQAANWVIEPAKSDDPEQQELNAEIADFVASNLFEDLPWQLILRQSNLRYDFGFMLFELLTDTVMVSRDRFPNLPAVRTSAGRPKKGEMVPAFRWIACDPRLPRTVDQWVPREDRPMWLAEVKQWTSFGGKSIRAEHLLRFTHDQEGANYEGTSVLRAVYKTWRQLDHLERVDAIRHERQNVGIPVVEFEKDAPTPSEEELDDIAETLEYLGAFEQAFMITPRGAKFRFDTSGQGEGTKVLDRIQDLKRDILDNVLAGFLMVAGGGSYAKAEVDQSHQRDYVELGVKFIEDVWNQGSDGWSPIRQLVDANYGRQDAYPKLKAKDVKGRDYLAVMKLLGTLIQSGALTAEPAIREYILSHLEIDAPYAAPDEGDDGRPTKAEEEEPKPAEPAKEDPAPAPEQEKPADA